VQERTQAAGSDIAERRLARTTAPTLVQSDAIADALHVARAAWEGERDVRALRRALLKLLAELE
jgi:hypothetical protein